jgi:hypothetical protein
VSTEYEPLYFYARVRRVEDINALVALESLHDPTLKAVGDVGRVLPHFRVVGPGAEYIMTPFVYPDPRGTRFAPPGGPGAFYAANTRETALREKGYHLERFLSASIRVPGAYEFAVLRCAVTANVADITARASFAALYHETDYTVAQQFALTAHHDGAEGIVYNSVRHPPGRCVAVFLPKRVSQCVRAYDVLAHFDGTRVTGYTLHPAGG